MAVRVVVAELEDEQRETMALLLEQAEGMELAGTAGDGMAVLELVNRQHPDVLVCGMLMPRLDGCGILERLEKMPLESRPLVIMVSAVKHEDRILRAFELGASDYLIKPYEPQVLVRRITELARHQNKDIHLQHASLFDQRLSGILLRLGIPAHVKGYRFLQEAVRLALVEQGMTTHMMHDLYPRVAKKYQTTPSCVERSIRNAICMAWERGRPEESSRILGRSVNASYERPTSGELIALVAERMRLSM